MSVKTRDKARAKRKARVRGKVSGTSERPRMTVFRSNRHMSVQVIDDLAGKTLVGLSSGTKALRIAGSNAGAASALGEAVAKACKEKGIGKVVFDRNGYLYHGRVKALADAARANGLEF